MPWEIRIVNTAPNLPLGAQEVVRERLAAALPGADLQRTPGPPAEFLAIFSEETRAAMARPKLEALYEEGDFTIEFYCDDEPQIRCLYADVRGNGNPLPALARLCVPVAWTVISSADETPVDLTAASAKQWEGFRQWRDQALEEMDDEE